MSANFDINLYLNKKVNYNEIIKWLNVTKIPYEISEINAIDNWTFENQRVIENDNIKLINKLISEEKIILVYGKLIQKHSFGVMISYKETISEVNIWVSTKELLYLEDDYINEKNIEVYDSIINFITTYFNNMDFLICGIGVETIMSEDRIVEKLIADSYNVSCFILPKKYEVNNPGLCDIQKIDNYFIYFLKKRF
ncbi:hypothetical protein [Thomasclavelia cocleata]|uniref:hypothetical protein n=1 Tax=Thomasclavelia cocleata TaxID=69824 RepID=UPI003EBEFB4A